jgi:hypothetical protein
MSGGCSMLSLSRFVSDVRFDRLWSLSFALARSGLLSVAFGCSCVRMLFCFRLLCIARGGAGSVYLLFVLYTYPICYVYRIFCYVPPVEYIQSM